jgi:hypothetical protein
MEGSAFLGSMVEVFPYKIHIVLTDNGMAFADMPKYRDSPSQALPAATSSAASASKMASSTG